MLWTLLMILYVANPSCSRPTNRNNDLGEKLCRVGNVSFPVPVFEIYAGWECYEEIYREMKELTVHVCKETVGGEEFSVPCFKSNGKMLNFNLKNDETVVAMIEAFGSRELNDDMIRCYLSVVAACETSPDGWLAFHGGCRFFVSNTTADVCGLEGQSKFHIAMLSISLIIGILVAVVFTFASISESASLIYCRNLIWTLIVRTLFSLLVETEIVSEKIKSQPGEPIVNWAGCEALASFETIALNMVLASWLILTFYIFESSKSYFRKNPDIRKGVFIVLGLAVTFAIIWIIVMAAGGYGNCWLERTPLQWINDALRLGFILLQVVLATAICYRVLADFQEFVAVHTRMFARSALFTMALSPLFLLQFSLSASHPVEPDGEAHIYTEFFFDGLQCALVSIVLLYSFMSVISDYDIILNGIASCLGRERPRCNRVFDTMGGTEMEIRHGDAPPRVARLPSPTPNVDEEEKKDVTYSSVLTPERFEKTIKLYNRLNILPKEKFEDAAQDNSSVKSEYFDVDNESVNTVYDDVFNQPVEDTKQRYYRSKYLVHDTESSVSEESVVQAAPEVKPSPSSTSSAETVVLPPGKVDTSQGVERWLDDCQSEFQDCTEKALRNNATQNTIHKSPSESLPTSNGISESVKAELENPPNSESVRAEKNSSPSLITSEEEEVTKKEKELPSIYDDLKEFPRLRNVNSNRKRNYGSDWSAYKNRVLDKRRKIKSLDSLDPVELQQDVMSPQVNALLSPTCDNNDFQATTLRKNHLSGVEDLSKVGDDINSDNKMDITDRGGTSKRQFADAADV